MALPLLLIFAGIIGLLVGSFLATLLVTGWVAMPPSARKCPSVSPIGPAT